MKSIYQNAKKKKDENGIVIYGLPRSTKNNIDFSDIPGQEFIVEIGDRLDVIAEQIYGDPTHWKAICLYNNIGYIFDITPGMIIKLPYDINKVWERV